MISEEEQKQLGIRIHQLVKQLDKIRWELIGMSFKLLPAFNKGE